MVVMWITNTSRGPPRITIDTKIPIKVEITGSIEWPEYTYEPSSLY